MSSAVFSMLAVLWGMAIASFYGISTLPVIAIVSGSVAFTLIGGWIDRRLS